jgi:AAA domain-containing protein
LAIQCANVQGSLPGKEHLISPRMCAESDVISDLVSENTAANVSVEEIIADRLAESDLSQPASDLVLAALLGDADLAATIAGSATPPKPRSDHPADSTSLPHLYLQAIIVQGFRGIGPQTALRLQPGPGLTVVAGRNGSGKSSFAEAAEIALTGHNMRWAKRSAVWRDGWRNLHTATQPAFICLELTADGQPGVLKVVREWPAQAGLDGAVSYSQAHGQPRQPLTAMNWPDQLELFRPFLSYSELGDLVSGTPSAMYDAIQDILGLEQLVDAQKRLDEQRKRLEEPSKQAAKALPGLRGRLAVHPDGRARQAEQILASKSPDLAAIGALAVGSDSEPASGDARLAQIAAIELPSADAVATAIEELRAASQHVGDFADTPAADARRLAGLLTTALEHHTHHPDEPCPVCGSRALDETWADQTWAEVASLRIRAQEAQDADRNLQAATASVRDLLGAIPRVLTDDLGNVVNTADARAAWKAWTELAKDATSPAELIANAVQELAAVATTVTALQTDAAAVLKTRSEAWQPVAAALAAWAEQARTSEQATASLHQVRHAIAWLKDAGQEIRDSRMTQFTAASAQVWEMLRQESNVNLGPIRLVGAATQRRLTLDVTVDGVGSAALSVMSQGELHALGLTLFLPRATAEESPFRFVVIDDPVQAMDPAKVDGLARLLAKVGESRQVIVFTHDDRLPEAVRRLQLPATIWEVTRREQSVVELRKNEDPVQRYIEDALAIAQTSELSEPARGVVAAGFCRSALEAACHQSVRARRIRAGVAFGDVERELLGAQKVQQAVALAMLDDARRNGEVVSEIAKRFGQRAASAFKAARAGTHAGYEGDLRQMVRDTEHLANRLRS